MIEKRFFDRDAHLEVLRKRAYGLREGYRQNIAILGDEMVGKTSMLHKFLSSFYDSSINPLYIEVRYESIDSFARRFIAVMLYNFLSTSGTPLKEDLDYLILKSEKFIPRTVEKIRVILSATKKRTKNNIFPELLSLCELLFQETSKHSVVIFDEFHNLEDIGFPALYREWSKVLISQKHTMYIITSSMKFKSRNILSKNLSLLFGNFEVLNVEPFDIATCERYLEAKDNALFADSGLRDFIIHFTGGFPIYLEVISEALIKQGKERLAELLEHLLFDSCGLLNQRFSNYIKRFQDAHYGNDYISILYLVASGRNKIKDIAHILKKQKKDCLVRINKLMEVDAITRTGDFLKINDRVFGFWVKFVYQEKLQSLTFDAKNQKARFRDRLTEMIADFYKQTQKPVIERMTEVLRLFEDEVIQIEKKKVKLNHFREIKPLEFRSRAISQGLIGRSSESLWIMAFKNQLSENDISEFSRECKKYRHKLQRKIIVTLGNIDQNTRLRAMEEKVWAWDANNLNQLLDLYSKPWVIA